MEKLKLFQLKDMGTIMYLDLDIRIQKPIDHMFDYCVDNPVICYTYWKERGEKKGINIHDFPYHSRHGPLSNFNSSVMCWKDATHIWKKYSMNTHKYHVAYPNGDDTFLYHEGFTFEHFPKEEIYSYMFDGRTYQKDKTICLLNGQDRYPEIEKEYDELCMHQVGH